MGAFWVLRIRSSAGQGCPIPVLLDFLEPTPSFVYAVQLTFRVCSGPLVGWECIWIREHDGAGGMVIMLATRAAWLDGLHVLHHYHVLGDGSDDIEASTEDTRRLGQRLYNRYLYCFLTG